MTPTIQCLDDHSMQIPPASVQRDDMFFEEHQLTSATERINSSSDVQTHQCTPYLRNRNSTFNRKKSTPCTSTALKHTVKKLLENSSEETASEEDLDLLRKRQALLLATINTMTLLHQNEILGRKLSALHKKVMQIPHENTNSGSTE